MENTQHSATAGSSLAHLLTPLFEVNLGLVSAPVKTVKMAAEQLDQSNSQVISSQVLTHLNMEVCACRYTSSSAAEAGRQVRPGDGLLLTADHS